MQPLADRSNSRSPSPTSIRSLPRKKSKRHLVPNLDSSECTPSEHSSLFDAVYWRSSDHVQGERVATDPRNDTDIQQHRADTSHTNNEKGAGAGPLPEFSVRFVNNPHGTPLSTIIEQRSFATLKSKASSRRFIPVHTHPDSKYLPTAASPDIRKRTSFSLDEQVLRELELQRLEDEEDLPLKLEYARPASPSHPPFQRTATPPGQPRWPGDLPTSAPPAPPRLSSRQRMTRTLRDAFRVASAPQRTQNASAVAGQPRRASMPIRTGRAYWRPPRSGYGALGVDELDRHPFRSTSSAANEKIGGATAPNLIVEADVGSALPPATVQPQSTVIQAALDGGDAANTSAPVPQGRTILQTVRVITNDTAAATLIRSLSLTRSQSPTEILDAVLDVSANIDRSAHTSRTTSSEHVTPPLAPNLPVSDQPFLQRSSRDDTTTRYTASGVPIYRLDAPSPSTHTTPTPLTATALPTPSPPPLPSPRTHPNQELGQTYACPHLTSAARAPFLAAPLTPVRTNSTTYAHGKEQRCWKCRIEDRVNKGVAWMLARCFCQPRPRVGDGMGEDGEGEMEEAVRPVVLDVGTGRWCGRSV